MTVLNPLSLFNRFSNRSVTAFPALSHSSLRRQALGGLAALSVLALGACSGASTGTPAKNAPSGPPASPSTTAPGGGPRESARAVVLGAVQERVFAQRFSATAELRSLSAPEVAAEVSARVKSVLVQSGQTVRKGQTLVVLDDSEVLLGLSEAQSQVAQLDALRQERVRAAERAETLWQQDFISRAQRDAAQTEALASTAQWDAARSRLQQAQSMSAKTRVVAPFDATVTEVRVQPGALTRTGEALLRLWSPQSQQLVAAVPQEHVLHLQAGLPVKVTGLDGREHDSSVLRWSPVVSAVSRSAEATLQVPAELSALAGSSLRAQFEVRRRTALAVPASALLLEGHNAQVVKAVQGRAQRTTVQVGQQLEGWVEVLSGLQAGDVVVTDGVAFVQEGQALAPAGATTVAMPATQTGASANSTRDALDASARTREAP